MNKLGFSCMRLPTAKGKGNIVDHERFRKMIDLAMGEGCCYFDTAHVYMDGNSETAIRDDLVARYPRDSFLLANKLSASCFEKRDDIIPFFEKQLEACGVTYFDYYLMHGLTAHNYDKFAECRAYKIAQKLKEEGKIRHIGISFCGEPRILRWVLKRQKEIEVVQFPLNYIDLDNPMIRSGELYDACRKHGKSVILTDPFRGGVLSKLPEYGADMLTKRKNGSQASYALRYAAAFPGVVAVLTGMTNMKQLADNVATMKAFEPLSYEERKVAAEAWDTLSVYSMNTCTGCGNCVSKCPVNIPIPELLACVDSKRRFDDWASDFYYNNIMKDKRNGKASDCTECFRCEGACPSRIKIASDLHEVVYLFEENTKKREMTEREAEARC